eukprot:4371993-Pyramimonas_sp.AAC.1
MCCGSSWEPESKPESKIDAGCSGGPGMPDPETHANWYYPCKLPWELSGAGIGRIGAEIGSVIGLVVRPAPVEAVMVGIGA